MSALAVIILFLPLLVSASPEDEVVYNQSQSGTENLRLLVNDLAVVVAPAEALLAAEVLPDFPKPKNREKYRLPSVLMNLLYRRQHN